MTTTITFEAYDGTPTWNDLGSNHLVFSGSNTDLTISITPAAFNDGTHAGNGTPGTDQCGATHIPNTKLIDATHFSHNGGSSTVLNDTNLLDTYCTFRIHFYDISAYQVQNGRFYSFDGSATANRSVGVDAGCYVKYQSMTQWQTLNSDTTLGPTISGMNFTTAGIGGDTTGNYVILADQLTNITDHFWYIALSVSPEVTGPKSWSVGAYFEYF